MKNQALFSSKDKSKKLKCHLLQFLFGALRVKIPSVSAAQWFSGFSCSCDVWDSMFVSWQLSVGVC